MFRAYLGKYRNIVISIALFLILDLGVLILNFVISSEISSDAVNVNLAGRQRMLSQRIAKTACGKNNVTVIVEAKGIGPDLVTKYNVRRVLDWIKNPRLPDLVAFSTAAPAGLPPPAANQPPEPGQDKEMPDYSQE